MYKCPKGDFVRPTCKYEAELLKNNQFKVDNDIITMNSDAIYNVYNFLACYTVCKLDKMNDEYYRFNSTNDNDLSIILKAFNINIPAKLYKRAELKTIKVNIKL